MFKKTLLCAGLLAVSGGVAAKAVGTATELVHSNEGGLGVISHATAAVTYDLGASYTQGDTITLTWSQPLAAGVGHGALEIKDEGAGRIPLTVLSNTANSVTYRAGAVPATYDYAEDQTLITVAKPVLGAAQASGASVTLSFSAATSTGLAIDTGTLPTTVALYYDQFGVDIVKANALIDVENSRKQFSAKDNAGDAHSTTVDVISAEINLLSPYSTALALNSTAAGMAATINNGSSSVLPATTVAVAGDYSWLDKASTAAFDIDATLGSVTPFNSADTSSSITLKPTVLTQAKDLTLTTTKVAVLSAKTYTATSTLKFANSAGTQKTKALAAVSAGSWGLNGATITAYGIPNQASVTPFLWVQNAGTTSGEITGTASCDGVTTDLGALGSAAGDTNTRVGPAVQAVMDGVTTCAVGSRYDVTLTVNAKSTDVTINAGYRVTAADGSNDRLSLETSDSLN